MTDTATYSSERGRGAALLTYVLYLLSIPSAGVLALVGLIVAYVGRAEAAGLARSHLDHQIRIWWTAFWWTLAIWIVGAIGVVLAIVLIGIPIIWLAGLASLVLLIWFTVVSLFGLLALLDGRGR
ncbi:MAG: hypothetical protein K2P58_02235 [Hyphomonadaceae bacterium]|nr:hypothetical protein [Hyphomonadaceae bacterium]